METAIHKVTLKKGGYYNVFCANPKQNREFYSSIKNWETGELIEGVESFETTVKGIHTFKQWKQILADISPYTYDGNSNGNYDVFFKGKWHFEMIAGEDTVIQEVEKLNKGHNKLKL